MHATTRIIVILTTLLLGFLPAPGFAQSNNANPAAFGIGKPVHILDLPDSAFRNNLLSLPPQARAKALRWMQEFNFPAADVASLRVDPTGGIYYADTFLPLAAESGTAEAPFVAEAIPESEIFKLHSRPGSSNVLFLDFDGHVVTGTAWNSSTGTDPLVALPFDPSTNDSPATVANFTSDELDRIGQMWHRISEDFSPFDIDVTTEEPAVFTNTTGRALFTHDTDANGAAMPSQGAGGVAYVPVFGWSNYVSTYSPAFVYYTNLYTNQHGDATLNAEAGSHEFGHNIGLSHDGSSSSTYYSGHGSGLVRWGPIMGGSYQDHVTQWSKGEYADANNQEDDLAIIAVDLGYITDDHADSSATASELIVEANGDLLVSSPELDPHNALTANKGVINNRTDVDWFFLDVGAGPLTLIATPSWHSFTSAPYRGSNLDIEMTLYNSALSQVDFDDPTTDTFATVSLASAAAGRYYVKIDGVGNANYSDFNSMGMYFIEGVVTPVSPDSTIPSPSPMSFASAPAATGAFSIAMTATTATDDSGFIEYQFACQASGGGCVTSAWQTSTSYTPGGLDASTLYSYVVRARDSSQNTTLDSNAASATTDPPPPGAPTGFTATAVSQTQINLGWTDASGDEDGFNLHRSTDQSNWTDLPDVAANATSYNDNDSGAGLDSGTQYFYEIRSFSNSNGASAWVSTNASTLQDPPNETPSGLTATAASSSQINLVWTDQATNASSFEVERSADGASGWSNIGNVSPGVQAFSSTGLSSGATWYYRVGAFTTGGINYSNVDSATTDFECTSAPITPAVDTWVMFALPCMPADNTVGAMVPLPDADYGGRWVVYYYNNDPNGNSPGYELLQLTSPMLEGMGYFFFSKDPVTFTIAGANNSGVDIDLRTDSVNGAFNLVGMLRNGLTDWPDVFVMDGANQVTLANADKKTGTYRCEQTPPNAQCLMSRKMHKWNGVAYDVYDGESPMFGVLDPFNVVWVKAFKSGVKLRIPAPAAGPSEAPAASGASDNTGKKEKNTRDKGKPQPWHIRLIAESGPHADRSNYLGQQKGTSDGQDHRDLEEPAPFGGKYLSVLFTNPDFAPVAWGYTSDFRELAGRPQGEWTFVVKASAEFEQVTLRWEGDAALFDNAVLIDEQTGETIAVQAGGSYTFSMVNGENHFSFVLP